MIKMMFMELYLIHLIMIIYLIFLD